MTLTMEAMNTKFYVDLFSNESTEWEDECRTWIRYVEKEWSRFLPDNELAMINEADSLELCFQFQRRFLMCFF